MALKWNRKLAYAIGLIATDGNLSKDGRHVVFVSKDLPLVKLFRKILALKNKISVKTSGFSKGRGKYYFIQFGDVKFYRDLFSLGLAPNKSKTIGKLLILDRYFADFLRGHLDGDGTIRTYDDSRFPRSRRLYVTFMSASKKHVTWLRSRIKSLYGISGKIRPERRVWILVYAKNESKTLLKRLYHKKELPCLDRKRNLILDFI
jgi:hypothetical protein